MATAELAAAAGPRLTPPVLAAAGRLSYGSSLACAAVQVQVLETHECQTRLQEEKQRIFGISGGGGKNWLDLY